MREMEIQSPRTEPWHALRMATASLAAMQREQSHAFSRLVRLQEQDIERMRVLLRNRRIIKREDASSRKAFDLMCWL